MFDFRKLVDSFSIGGVFEHDRFESFEKLLNDANIEDINYYNFYTACLNAKH
jgi:hypothetical protein